jgi:putative endonuclease
MEGRFTYVYVLESENCPERHYVGLANDLAERLRQHNTGNVRHTSKFMPWTIKAAIALRERSRAIALERYLKTHAGRKFCRAHL